MKSLFFHTAFSRFVLLIIIAISASALVNAATFTVTNTNDNGAGSLRQAILNANINNEDDTIEFDATVFNVPQTIVLTSGELDIEPDNASGQKKALTINGTGANLLTISGNNQSRVISIARDAGLVINKVKITGGNAIDGTGIFIAGGYLGAGVRNLTLTDSIISGNTATGPFGNGAGLSMGGAQVLIVNTTIANNVSSIYGGGISIGAGTDLRIINSTISDNTAVFGGGGIYNSSGNLYLTNCTIAFNQTTRTSANNGSSGGGIFLTGSLQYYAHLYVTNTIIAENTIADNNFGADIFGTIDIGKFNIIGNSTGTYINDSTGNQLDVDPQLDPELKTNGGITPTHALSAGSPAIDRGTNCVLNTTANGGCLDPNITTDQRGVSRPQDGDGDGTAIVDIGAFEASTAEISFTPNAPDLRAADDTGVSNSDNITASRNLTFDITGVLSGATVDFFRDGVKIASTTAQGNTVVFSDNNLPADGTFIYKVRQTLNNTTSLFSAHLKVTVDNTAPTVTINQATGQSDPTRTQPINFTVIFSEPVVGFNAAGVSLSGSTANVSAANIVVTGSGTTYNVAVSNITSDGNVRAGILPNAAQDLAGNYNSASTSTDNTVTLDTTPPTVTINQAAGQVDPTRNLPINFTVVFSEPVTGFTNADVSLAGSTANVAYAFISVTGSGTTYNVAISNITSNGGFVQASIPAGAAIDAAGNSSLASTSTDNTVTIDNVPPTVTINQAVGQADPTNNLPINFTVVFSEPVTGFNATGISLSNSTVNTSGASITITGSGTTYNVAISNITSNGGFIRAYVRPGAASDLVGNLNLASTSTDNTVTIDNVAPSATINQAIGQSDPTSRQPVNFTVVFSEPVTGFDASDVSLSGSTANVSFAILTVTGSGTMYNVAVSNITSSGQVRASIVAGAAKDAVGNLSFASTSSDNTITVNVRSAFDFDGDGKADVSVYRPSDGVWYLLDSSSGFSAMQFGNSTDKIVPADYDGDGKTDIAVFRDGTWYLQRSNLGFTGITFGQTGDIPVPADFDGDGKAEVAVFRPSNGTWYIYNLTTNQFTAYQFGQMGDIPVVGDYDGDGKADIAVYRPSQGTWYIQRSRDGFTGVQFGASTDKPVPADYDGDGKTDVAVYRPDNGTWYMLESNAGFIGVQFGISTDKPVPADYDGDGKADVAVFRDGTWYLNRSTAGFTGVAFGASTDKPIPNAFVP